MKKGCLFGMFALATMTMVGCSSDEVVNEVAADKAIEFGTYVGRDAASRATVIDVMKLADDGFGVFAYYTGTDDLENGDEPNFMNNQAVYSEDGETWVYEPVKYWPNNEGDKVSFLAYAPYHEGVAIETLSTNNHSIKFLVNSNVVDQEDLLYLCQGSDGNDDESCKLEEHKTINLTKQGVDETVNFHFLHALSRISFDAEVMVDLENNDQTGEPNDNLKKEGDAETTKTEQSKVALEPETTIEIKKVTLAGKFYKQGILNLNDGEWTPTETEDITKFVLGQSNFIAETEYKSYIFDDDDKENKRELSNPEDSYIMIIPQDFSNAKVNEDKLTITVEYDVVTEDSNLNGGNSTVTNIITSEPFGVNFLQGHAYKFTLHIGMTSVKLSATVEGWGNEKDITVNVPKNLNL